MTVKRKQWLPRGQRLVKTTSRSNALRKNNPRRVEKVESQQDRRCAELLILKQMQILACSSVRSELVASLSNFFPRSYKRFNDWPGQIRSLKSLDGLAAPSSSAPAWKLGAIYSSKDSGSDSILLSRVSFFILRPPFSVLRSPRFGSWALDVKTKTSWRSGWWGEEGPRERVRMCRRQKTEVFPAGHPRTSMFSNSYCSSRLSFFSFPVPVPVDDWKWMRRTSFSGFNGST
jgi:hypothetical protein